MEYHISLTRVPNKIASQQGHSW